MPDSFPITTTVSDELKSQLQGELFGAPGIPACVGALFDTFSESVNVEPYIEEAHDKAGVLRPFDFADDFKSRHLLTAIEAYRNRMSDIDMWNRMLSGGRALATCGAEYQSMSSGTYLIPAYRRGIGFFDKALGAFIKVPIIGMRIDAAKALASSINNIPNFNFSMLNPVDIWDMSDDPEQVFKQSGTVKSAADRLFDDLKIFDGNFELEDTPWTRDMLREGLNELSANPVDYKGVTGQESRLAANKLGHKAKIQTRLEDATRDLASRVQRAVASDYERAKNAVGVGDVNEVGAAQDKKPDMSAGEDASLESSMSKQEMLHLAGMSLSLLSQFSDELDIGRDGKKAIGALQNALPAFQMNLTLGAAVFLAGLFKKPKQDPTQMALRQIMESLQQIGKQLYDLQKAVYALHRDLIFRTNEISEEVRFNQLLISSIVLEPLEIGISFLNYRRYQNGMEFDFVGDRFVSYSGLRRHFATFSDQFKRGPRRLEDYVTNEGLHPCFLYKTGNKDEESPLRDYRKLVVDQLKSADVLSQQLLLEFWIGTKDEYIARTCNPPVRPNEVLRFDKEMRRRFWCPMFPFAKARILTRNEWCDSIPFINDYGTRPVNIETIKRTSRVILESHWYHTIIKSPDSGEIMSIDELKESFKRGRGMRSVRGAIVLSHLARLIDLAIYQLMLPSGIWLEPVVTKNLCEVFKTGDYFVNGEVCPKRRATYDILLRSAFLRRNWLTLLIRKSMLATSADSGDNTFSRQLIFKYHSGYSSPVLGKFLLSDFLPTELELHWEPRPKDDQKAPSGWHVVVPAPPRSDDDVVAPESFKVFLPDYRAVNNQPLQFDSRLADLVQIRRDISDALLEYDILKNRAPYSGEYYDCLLNANRILVLQGIRELQDRQSA